MVSQDTNTDFVGRNSEIALYEEWISHSKGPWILYFYDRFADQDKKGGIGKTWLLRKCVQLTQKHHPDKAIVTVDFFNVADRSGIVIAERVVNQLKAVYPTWSPRDSEAILAEYREARRDDVDDSTLQRRLANAIASDLSSLNTELERTDRYLLLFYDTFELIEQDPVVALLNPAQKFPDNYKFAHIGVVMAGRNALGAYWYGRERDVREVALGPFSLEEMVDYINKRQSILATRVADSWEMKALYVRTEGRPILIGLVTDIVDNQIVTLDDLLRTSPHAFEEWLVAKISDLEHPINWIILFMSHAYHRFNVAILDWMLQESSLHERVPPVRYQNMLQKLRTLSFVRHSTTGDDFVLHDEMRRLVIRCCWGRQDPYKENRIEISNCMIRYYEEALEHEQNKLMKQSYTVEMLYHKLFVNLDDGLKFFEEAFKNALRLWSPPYARSLLQETRKFTLSLEQEYRLIVLEARLLAQREEDPRRALTLYRYLQAEAEKDWFEQNRSTIYYGLADCFLSLGNFSEAIELISETSQIEQRAGNQRRYAEDLGTLGYIYQRQGQFDKAVEYYKQALAIYKQIGDRREYADKMNSLGNVYRIQGKIDEALRCCQIALKIREDLFEQGKVSEMQKGLSLSTIGAIYLDSNDVLQAEKLFQEAFVIFQRTGYKRGIARTYNRLGRIKEMQGDLDNAIRYFQDAYVTARSVDAQEEQISSLNKQGRVLMRQENLTKARECFEQARELSQQTHDYYQEAESLTDLAQVLEYSGMHNESVQALARGREIALQYHYYSLLGTIEDFLGLVRYGQQNYDTAFSHFVQSCHYMALFNSLRYNEAIRLLIQHLLQIPGNSRSGIISMIRAYWSDNDLNEKYPHLIRACQDVEELAL
jgi:tetratricopeptide (TPR) repeat protein